MSPLAPSCSDFSPCCTVPSPLTSRTTDINRFLAALRRHLRRRMASPVPTNQDYDAHATHVCNERARASREIAYQRSYLTWF